MKPPVIGDLQERGTAFGGVYASYLKVRGVLFLGFLFNNTYQNALEPTASGLLPVSKDSIIIINFIIQ